jgi:hypothetical protein
MKACELAFDFKHSFCYKFKIGIIRIDSAKEKECSLWEKEICARNGEKSTGGLTVRPALGKRRLKEGKRNRIKLSLPPAHPVLGERKPFKIGKYTS